MVRGLASVHLVVALSGVIVIGMALAVAFSVAPAEDPSATLSVSVDGDDGEIALVHEGGETLDVTELSLCIEVDGDRLAEQPSVPFFSVDGFESGPTGPFNSRSPNQWEPDERASFRLAGTNEPMLSPGDSVTVLVVSDSEGIVLDETVTAR